MLLALCAVAALATTPSPSPAPTPRPLGLSFSTTLATTFLSQNTLGPGQIGPEAAGLLAGGPLAPNTPYDTFSSAPTTPGVAAIVEALTTATARTKKFDFSLDAALEYVEGSVTNAAYWGENLIPALNPHMGSRTLPYAVTFPTAPGQDDGSGVRFSVLGGSLATADGNLAVRLGYLDLAQTDRFVFAQPPLASVNPAIAYAPAETLSSGVAGSDDFLPLSTQLPLDGADVVAKDGSASLELTTAALPSPPGLSARATLGSLVFDRGEGTRFSFDVLHATTSGISFGTSAAFGAGPQFVPSPQGILTSSTLSGQQQTVAGASASVHLMPRWDLDAIVEIARAWYAAQNVAQPGTAKPGGFYHAGLVKTFGRATASIDVYRVEPRYATIVLPYGIPENQWSAAWAWPAPWLGSSYQTIDNTVAGIDRQGYRLRYFLDQGPLELHFEFTDLRQIEPSTTGNLLQTGFVGGYFPPEPASSAALGRQQKYGAWAAWHASFGDVTLDYIDDEFSRPSPARMANVALSVPQAVLTYSRHVAPSLVIALGYGTYAMKGTFAEPVDFVQHLFFMGAIVKESPRTSLLATFRTSTFGGISSYPPLPLSPDFSSSQIIVEQRYQI